MELDQERLEYCLRLINEPGLMAACKRLAANPLWSRGVGLTTAQCWLIVEDIKAGESKFLIMMNDVQRPDSFKNQLTKLLDHFFKNIVVVENMYHRIAMRRFCEDELIVVEFRHIPAGVIAEWKVKKTYYGWKKYRMF